MAVAIATKTPDITLSHTSSSPYSRDESSCDFEASPTQSSGYISSKNDLKKPINVDLIYLHVI